MKTIRFLPLLALFCLALTGCGPDSINPIVPLNHTAQDPRLEGVWMAPDKNETTYYHFGQRRASGRDGKTHTSIWMDVVGVEHPKNGALSTGGYAVLPAKIGSRTYLSFAEQKQPGRGPGSHFNFARYDFNWKGDLRIYLADEDALADAIRAGKLHGKVKSNQFGKDVLLTDSSAHLEAFFAAHDDPALFKGEPLVLHRR